MGSLPFTVLLPKDIEILFSGKIEMPKENIYRDCFWEEVQQNLWVLTQSPLVQPTREQALPSVQRL